VISVIERQRPDLEVPVIEKVVAAAQVDKLAAPRLGAVFDEVPTVLRRIRRRGGVRQGID
jgi:hypothetical protein